MSQPLRNQTIHRRALVAEMLFIEVVRYKCHICAIYQRARQSNPLGDMFCLPGKDIRIQYDEMDWDS